MRGGVTIKDEDVFVPSTNRVYRVPAGTPVIEVNQWHPNGWAVATTDLAMECGMSDWDATHRYLFVKSDNVKVTSP